MTLTLVAVNPSDEDDGGTLVTFWCGSPEEVRAIGARYGRELVLDLPGPQPADVYTVAIPEEEAEVNGPKRKAKS